MLKKENIKKINNFIDFIFVFCKVGFTLGEYALYRAGVAELVDALDLGSSDFGRGGSIPFTRTIFYKKTDYFSMR